MLILNIYLLLYLRFTYFRFEEESEVITSYTDFLKIKSLKYIYIYILYIVSHYLKTLNIALLFQILCHLLRAMIGGIASVLYILLFLLSEKSCYF